MLSPHCSRAASVSNTFTQLCLLLTLWVTRTYHVTVTQTRVWGKDLFSKTPLSAGNRALLCRCFHLQRSLLVWIQYCPTPPDLVFLQHNEELCGKTYLANLCGYSHQCHLTQECQRGRVGLAGPEVQVDPSETQTERKKGQTATFTNSLCAVACSNNQDAVSLWNI